jgi:hypothetical protein
MHITGLSVWEALYQDAAEMKSLELVFNNIAVLHTVNKI